MRPEPPSSKRFVSVGECMIEMSGGEDRQYRLGYAGDTLNTAWYMRALLRADWSVDYLTRLGEDRYSIDIRAFLQANGIGTNHIRTVRDRHPGLYMIHQEAGDRHFTYWRDSSAARLLADNRNDLAAAFASAGVVYFSGITLAILAPRARRSFLDALAGARDAGAKIVFDPNVRPRLWTSARDMVSVLTAAATLCQVVLPTYCDEAPLFGDRSIDHTADRYLELGVEEVAVKDGPQEALFATCAERVRMAPTLGASVIDATGAGDSFNAGYLSARLLGKTLSESARLGHDVASIVIAHKGALVDMGTFR